MTDTETLFATVTLILVLMMWLVIPWWAIWL
jgi:hypothetical protein